MQENNENEIENLTQKVTKNIKDILSLSIKLKQKEGVLVIFDNEYGLTDILTDGYKIALQDFYNNRNILVKLADKIFDKNNFENKVKFLDFNKSNKEEILGEINKLKEKDLVVMIQTTNFRLDDFRIRLHLFSKKLKVIEHMHLNRNLKEVWDVYVNSLEYDKDYYYNTAHNIKNKIDNSKNLKIKSYEKDRAGNILGENILEINGELEDAKLNIGDYDKMENIGGTFPIGEVFTESKEIKNMNGEVLIYALANKDFTMQMYEPFLIKIENGVVISYVDNAPLDFINVYNEVKDYETPIIREIGFGLNRAITKKRYLGDITAFERIYGMHLSMGEKHGVYKKEGLIVKKTRYHVDLFPVVDCAVSINKNTDQEQIIFEDGIYILN